MTDKVQRTLEGMVKEFEAIESLDLLEPQELVYVWLCWPQKQHFFLFLLILNFIAGKLKKRGDTLKQEFQIGKKP